MTNIAILTGRIAREPDTRETKGGTNVTGITIVTDRPARDKDGKTYKDENGYTAKESEFHRVTCFNGLAKTVGQYCSKGQLVSVQGRIHYTQWEDKDGVTRYGTEILADKGELLQRRVKGRVGAGVSGARTSQRDSCREQVVAGADAALGSGGEGEGLGHRGTPFEHWSAICSLYVPSSINRRGVGKRKRADAPGAARKFVDLGASGRFSSG